MSNIALIEEWNLSYAVKREFLFCLGIIGGDGTGFHTAMGHARKSIAVFHDAEAFILLFLKISMFVMESVRYVLILFVRGKFVDWGRILFQGFKGIENAFPDFIFHLDKFQGLAGDLRGFGSDSGYFVPNAVYTSFFQDRMIPLIADVIGVHIVGGYHAYNAGKRFCFGSVDGNEVRMGIFSPQDSAVQHVGQDYIVPIDGFTAGSDAGVQFGGGFADYFQVIFHVNHP